MKFKIDKDTLDHVLHGVNEMLAWCDIKLKSLEEPTKDDSLADATAKLLQLALLMRYSEMLINVHNLIIALAHNDGIINLEKEKDDDESDS